jgi:hypothetical protein
LVVLGASGSLPQPSHLSSSCIHHHHAALNVDDRMWLNVCFLLFLAAISS